MIYVLGALAAAAAAYQILVLLGAMRWLRRSAKKPGDTPGQSAGPLRSQQPAGVSPGFFPPVSVLKPVHGLDSDLYECFRSHALQDYPEFEILFGVGDPADPAVPEIERLAAEFPRVPVRLVVSATKAPNAKAGVLADLAAVARHGVLLVNDSDIRVPRDYLRRVVAPLEDPAVGMVTCLYRARARTWPARFEAAGIATDFIPGVLVAPLVGVSEFALGATMVLRASDLARIGGFAAVAGYIADDYQLGSRIRGLGLRVVLSRCVVETSLDEDSWAGVWRHQVRWARTIRVSRGGGYAGLPVANATLWAVLLAAAGLWPFALALFGLRLAAGTVCSAMVLRDPASVLGMFLMGFRDLAGLGVWFAGLFGSTVMWRGTRLRLNRDGRITPDLTHFPATR